jgi:ankyrin repeat protein
VRSALSAFQEATDNTKAGIFAIRADTAQIASIKLDTAHINDIRNETARIPRIMQEMSQITNIKHDTSRTKNLAEQFDLFRLQIIEVKQHDNTGGIILQRYLDETTSYADSVADTQGTDFVPESINTPTVASIDQFATRDESDCVAQSQNSPATRMEIDGLTASTSTGNQHRTGERDLVWKHTLTQGQHNDFTTTQALREQNTRRGNHSQEHGLPTDVPIGNGKQAKKDSLARPTKLLDLTAIAESQNARQRLFFWTRGRLDKKLEDIVCDAQYYRQKLSSTSRVRGCSGGHQEIEDLLNQGADVNFCRSATWSEERRDILDEELYHNGRPDVVELLLSRGANPDLMRRALSHGHLASNAHQNGEFPISHLLEIIQSYESDTAAVEMFNEDVLYCAAVNGQGEAVLKLLQRGVNVNARAHVSMSKYDMINRDTALIGACSSNQIAVVKLLLEHGANINPEPSAAEGTTRTTALISASTGGSAALVELLLENGAETDPITANGREFVETTALLSACRAGKVEVVKLLLENGADIRALDVKNRDAVETTLDAWTTRPGMWPSGEYGAERCRIVQEYCQNTCVKILELLKEFGSRDKRIDKYLVNPHFTYI